MKLHPTMIAVHIAMTTNGARRTRHADKATAVRFLVAVVVMAAILAARLAV